MNILKKEKINELISLLNGWKYESNSILKEFTCKNFSEALALLIKIGIIAEKNDHHPDLILHSWNKLKVILSTHSVGGVTLKDFEVANQIEKLF